MVSVAVLINDVCVWEFFFFFASLFACFVGFSFFGFVVFLLLCQSPAVCSGNSVVGGCTAPKGF